MELWIRSQDRKRLMKTNGFDYVEYGDKHIINGYGTCECDNYDLGIYATKERALEVLDEITDFIDGLNRTNTITIYEMPKE